MKNIIKLIILLKLLFVFTSSSFALTKIYDLEVPSEYTVSNSDLIEVSDWYWRLIPQLNYVWEITNSDPWTHLNNVEDILVDWNYLYAAWARSDWIDVIDISTPSSPSVVWSITNWWNVKLNDPRAMAKSWNYLYVSSRISDAIEIIDVSTPSNPTHVASISDGWLTYLNWTRWLTISWNYLYATSYDDDAIEIIDISTPSNPTHVWSLRSTSRLNWAWWIAISWNYAYVTSYNDDSIQVIDISNPSSPNFTWEITNGWNTLLNWARQIVIEWNYAYVASYISDAVQIIDISTPSNPSAVTNIVNWWDINIDWVSDLYIFTNRLMVSSRNWEDISIIRIDDPTNPTIDNSNIIWTNPNLSWATSIVKVWAYTYIWSNTEDSIVIIDSYVDSSWPYIVPNEALTYSGTIDQWSVNLPVPENVTYQISKDNWTTWYYLSWSTWTATNSGTIYSNSPEEMNSELQAFNNVPWWTWQFKWKAFLNSPWNLITEIDSVTVYYSTESTYKLLNFETAWGYTVTEWTWTRTTNNPYEWTYSLESWNHNDSTNSCFEFSETIYNDSTISFYKEVSSEINYDYLRFYIDWIKQSEWSWTHNWNYNSYNLENWYHTFKWCYEKDYSISLWSDTAWIDYIEINEKPIIVEDVILDFEISWWYTVTTTETSPWPDWQRVTTEKNEGSYSIESQNRSDNTESCFERQETLVTWDTWISFYKKISSEASYDFLIFYIDSVEQDKWAWEIPWSKEIYTLSTWTYTLKWCYKKDGSVSNWQDRAWIDYVVKEQDIPIISEVTPVDTPTNDNTPDYTFYSPISWAISYSWSCSSTTTWAIVWNNTITFDILSDWIYTDCTIQVLWNPNSNILSVNNFVVDTTTIDITINNPIDLDTITNSAFNIDVSYNDDNWVNTWSIVLNLYSWNWNSYWPDIASNYVNFTWASISSTWAIYPTSALWEWQFKVKFSIEDTTWNIWISDSVFYVTSWDASWPEVTFNNPYLDYPSFS